MRLARYELESLTERNNQPRDSRKRAGRDRLLVSHGMDRERHNQAKAGLPC